MGTLSSPARPDARRTQLGYDCSCVTYCGSLISRLDGFVASSYLLQHRICLDSIAHRRTELIKARALRDSESGSSIDVCTGHFSGRRILFAVNLDPSQKFGSLEEQIFLLSSALSKKGGFFHPVFIADMGKTQHIRYRDAGLAAASLDLSTFQLGKFHRLVRMIDRYGIEIVHWNFYSPLNLYVPLLRVARPRIRHIFTDHHSRPQGYVGSNSYLKRISKKAFAALYSRILAVSDYVLEELRGQGIWPELLRYHHFVNTDRFRPDRLTRDSLRAAQGCEQNFVILVIAHLIQEKGVDIAIRSLTDLPPRAILWIVGDGPEQTNLQNLSRSLGLQNRISFFGLQADVCQFMQAADCLVCPSLWQEAAGLVLLEAMACGLPVIASSVGGIPEFVIPGQTGYLFPPGNHSVLVRCINSLIDDEPLSQQMALSARCHAVAKFSHAIRIDQALSIYDLNK